MTNSFNRLLFHIELVNFYWLPVNESELFELVENHYQLLVFYYIMQIWRVYIYFTQKNVCLNQTTKFVWFRIIERNKFFASINKKCI